MRRLERQGNWGSYDRGFAVGTHLSVIMSSLLKGYKARSTAGSMSLLERDGLFIGADFYKIKDIRDAIRDIAN